MAISFVNVGTAAGAGSGNIQPGTPASIQNNDILICAVAQYATSAVTLDQSYTKKFEGFGGGRLSAVVNFGKLSVWWKRTSGTESTVTVSGAADSVVAQIIALRGVYTTGDPFEAEEWNGVSIDGAGMEGIFSQQTQRDTSDFFLGGFTTLTNGAWIFWALGSSDNNTISVAPTGGNVANLTNRFNTNTALGSDCCLFAWTADLATAGNTGTPTGNQGPDPWIVWGGALKPA